MTIVSYSVMSLKRYSEDITRKQRTSITTCIPWNCQYTQQTMLLRILVYHQEPGSSVSIVSDYGLGDRGSIPGRGERIFPLSSVSRPTLGPTQPSVQWVPWILSRG
jgi:hypothetical protein